MKSLGLSASQLNALTSKQVYEWVKTGHWTHSEFSVWVLAVRATEQDAGAVFAKFHNIPVDSSK